jgi:hypothetical protein
VGRVCGSLVELHCIVLGSGWVSLSWVAVVGLDGCRGSVA